MNRPIETEPTAAVTNEATCRPFASATLFCNGLERVIEASKTSLDLAVELNADVLASCKQALNTSSMPGGFLFDLSGRAFEGYVTIQKGLLDLTLEQNTALGGAAQEYSHDASEAKAGITKVIRQSVDRTEPAQKTVVDLAKKVSDTVKQQREGTKAH